MRNKRRGRSLAVVIISLYLNNPAAAQQVKHYDTYDNALKDLLNLGSIGCFGLLGPSTFSPQLLPSLVGPNLLQYCDPNLDSHLFAGGVIGGTLSSTQPSRSISQFSTSRRRSRDKQTETVKANNYFADVGVRSLFDQPDVFATIVTEPDLNGAEFAINYGVVSIFSSFTYEHLSRAPTRFEGEAKYDYFEGKAGVSLQLTPQLLVGTQLNYQETDGTLIKPSTINVRELVRNTPISAITIPAGFEIIDYSAACGVGRKGSTREDETGISVFASWNFEDSGFVQGQIGAGKTNLSYSDGRCILQVSSSNDELTFNRASSGILHGETDGYKVEANIYSGYDFRIGDVSVGPRVGLNFLFNHIDAYSESETQGGESTIFDETFPFGAGLNYDAQDAESVQSRLGFAISRTILLDSIAITPFAQLDYIHEFANDQRRVAATFVEDLRPNPQKFTFLTNAPDRDYFELSGGAFAQISGSTAAFARGSVLLGNSLYDGYAIEAGLSWKF
ncbi:autotransporter domain-containing protein [Sinorhizobium meliloti]|nr:autotransporter domain-containing protein [Sinorhizobium meliloti]MDX0325997.1 autotransporter domain-containing protein [Sinorhizobium meliloti]